MKTFLGIDVGSISANFALVDKKNNIVESLYLKTHGNPINATQEGIRYIKENLQNEIEILGVGTTGSARNIIGIIVGADVIKNEITAHAVGAINFDPRVRTVIDIGGQDSKIIIIRNGITIDFAMNTVCAAGTGSFLEQQCGRIGIQIEEFGDYAIRSKNPVKIAGRCTVFAESDMIHKQQIGHCNEDIINGLCEALVRNYLNNVAKGKEIREPIFFQGGVAANLGIKMALERLLNMKPIVPRFYNVMGAIGVAIIAKSYLKKTGFKGYDIINTNFKNRSFDCKDCTNFCEVVELIKDEETIITRWGDRCGKWSESLSTGRYGVAQSILMKGKDNEGQSSKDFL
ncbi:2-hydroxyglutaryl-CoA dehydratase [bacterium]|nr:2-hydroxyglutaryl-CoA dehydratase [bacterium]